MDDNFEQNPYFLIQASMMQGFRIASQMVHSVKMNFQSDKAFKDDLWKCIACGRADSQQQLLYCLGYEIYRKDKDLSKDKDLVTYFRNIIQDRMDNI